MKMCTLSLRSAFAIGFGKTLWQPLMKAQRFWRYFLVCLVTTRSDSLQQAHTPLPLANLLCACIIPYHAYWMSAGAMLEGQGPCFNMIWHLTRNHFNVQ